MLLAATVPDDVTGALLVEEEPVTDEVLLVEEVLLAGLFEVSFFCIGTIIEATTSVNSCCVRLLATTR